MAHKYAGLKHGARELRARGSTYGEISRSLDIPKSTLHSWVYDLPPSSYQQNPQLRLKHLARIRPLASRVLHEQKVIRLAAIQKRVQEEVKRYPLKDLMVQRAFAALLYWAEGTKTEKSVFKFANTDPKLALLFLTLLRKAFSIEEQKIQIYLYLHHYHHVATIRKFWSNLLGVPESQFAKVYIKSRRKTKRKRKNFAGICFIRYGRGSEGLKQELLFLAREIQQAITRHAHL